MTSRRILAIDDDRFFTHLARHIAAQDGYLLDECNDASRIDVASLQSYDFILLDIIMPNVNGIDMLSKIRRSAPDTDVILVTAIGDEFARHIRDFASNIGINLQGILRKPFTRLTLSALLSRRLNQRAPSLAGYSLLLLREEVEAAIVSNQLLVKFWPQVLLRSNRWVGFDVSLHYCKGELAHPISNEIVNTINDPALSLRYDSMAIKHALPVLGTASSKALTLGGITIGVTPHSIASDTFRDELMTSMTEHCIHKGQLSLEIPASCLIAEPQRVKRPLQLLRTLGFRISARGSPLELLTIIKGDELPFDEIKIADFWTAEATVDRDIGEVVEHLLDVAAQRCVVSIAEGVTDAKTADFLVTCGCDIGQGPYFSEPLDIESLCSRTADAVVNTTH